MNQPNAIKEKARQLGFDHCQLVPIHPAAHADFFEHWIKLGHAGEMHYLARNQEKRRDPQLLAEVEAPKFCSMVVLGVNHYQFDLPPEWRDDPSRGLIASYAWGDDYHEIIRPQLYQLDAFIAAQSGRESRGKCLVDTGPVLERDWALNAGMGFTGKNCCTIHPGTGSWLLLATILVPEKLTYDPTPTSIGQSPTSSQIAHGLPPAGDYGRWQIPITAQGMDEPILDRLSSTDELPTDQLPTNQLSTKQTVTGTCGRCTRCLDACPTDAFIGPFHLSPQRCISYWTIEAKSPIPRALRSSFGNRIFGCDICQEVCPWNKRLESRQPLLDGLHAQGERIAPALLEGFEAATPYWLDRDAFNRQFRRSPIKRAKRHGMLRNVCVALGNWAALATIEPLRLALHDPEPLARGHAAWAFGQVHKRHPAQGVESILKERMAIETDRWVMEEIEAAL